MTNRTILIGDIGGTNARFALANTESPGYQSAATLQCAEYASADDAIRHYLADVAADKPDVVCLAAAGPLVANSINVTNNHWVLSCDEISARFGIQSVRLLNDFEAVAWSIPGLSHDDCQSIGSREPMALPTEEYRVAVLGPGTGLGTAALYCREGVLVPYVGEGAHTGFAPKSQRQTDIFVALQEKFGSVTNERLLSGKGLENIFWALTRLNGDNLAPLSAAQVFDQARVGKNQHAVDAVQLFFEILGQVAGDLALILGAFDGVYIAGGIAKRYPQMLQDSGFRNAFENNDKHRSIMERIPTQLITHEEPGLLGAAYCSLALSAS